MKYSAFLFLMYAAFQVTAENPEAYRKLDSERKENLLHNSGFEQNETHWQGIGENGWSIVRGEGRNGTNALCKSRAGRGEYTLAGQKELVLKPGVAYEFGGWIRTDRLTGPGAGHRHRMEQGTDRERPVWGIPASDERESLLSGGKGTADPQRLRLPCPLSDDALSASRFDRKSIF